MDPASWQYTLVGFSPELDWRPLTFLKPIPASRVCSACGLVRRRTALLPCMHVLCECCYEQCDQDGFNECPLDGNHYEKGDVALLERTAYDLLNREVKCWNEGNGCQYTTAAAGITQHLLLECERHSVRCPRCSAAILCKEVRAHHKSAFCNSSKPSASERQVPAVHTDESASLTSYRESFARQAGEITSYPKPIAADMSKQMDRLSEISRSVNTREDTLRQELAVLTRQKHDETAFSDTEECVEACSDRLNISQRAITDVGKTLNKPSGTRDDLSDIVAAVEQINSEVEERISKSLQPVTSVRRESALQVTHCEFFVKGVESLQDTAMEKGSAAYDSEQVYLRGYCMSPGVLAIKSDGPATLHARYTLHKGDMDDAAQWPFKHKIRMSVIHPRIGADRVLEVKPDRKHRANRRPSVQSISTYYLVDCFNLTDLITAGYVDNDQLRVKWELMP
ncbi:uncharacterized protein LOC144104382 isoform X6 [Amblyomma americanum]